MFVLALGYASYRRLTGEKPGLKEVLLGDGPHFDGLDLAGDSSSMDEVEF